MLVRYRNHQLVFEKFDTPILTRVQIKIPHERQIICSAAALTEPALKNQASRYSDRGVGLRRLDHIALLAADVRSNRQFMQQALGGRITEQIIFDDDSEKGAWVTFTNKSYDVTFAEDAYGARGRLHHVTYAVDNREAILRAADICLDRAVFIETGPHKHAIQQTFFLDVYEPGGNRFEVANAGARLILAPDWKPIVWRQAKRKKGQFSPSSRA